MNSALELVDNLAQSIATHATHNTTRPPTTTSLLELQIAFWSDELQRLRESHQKLLRHLLRSECYVTTDLKALDNYAPARIWHYRASARDNLKNKLLHLDTERRRIRTAHERDVRDLRERLLELLIQHALLNQKAARDHERQHHTPETQPTDS